MKEFVCRHTYDDGEKAEWTGTVTPIRSTVDMRVAEIKGRGSSFTVIAGEYPYGDFLCIPEINVGCPLSRWDDLFWNQERLFSLMNETDAVTISYGVKALMEGRTRRRKHNLER